MTDVEAEPELPVVATPPRLDPDAFDRHEGFRETTLAYFLDQKANGALRDLGMLLYTLVCEYWHHWPREPEGSFRHQARAAVADLRHLQGYLAQMGREHESSALTKSEERLSRRCRPLAVRAKKIADALERAIASSHEEEKRL